MFRQVSSTDAREIPQGTAGQSNVVPVPQISPAGSSSARLQPLRTPVTLGTRTIQTVVSNLGDATAEVRVENVVIGFIRQAGNLFVALGGDRLDRAEECGQFHSWEHAATELVTGSERAATQAPPPEDRWTVKRPPDRTSGRPSTDTDRDTPLVQAGEVLIFRPRPARRARAGKTSIEPITTELNAAVILHGGREFHTTRERAESFLAWARIVVDSGQAALVPLLHNDGVDLLLVTGNTPVESGRR